MPSELAGEAPVLDRSVIDSLRGLCGVEQPDAVSELCALFFDDMEARLVRVRRAFEAGDRSEVARQAHAIKGASGNLGAMRIYILARQMEAEAKAGRMTVELGAVLIEELARVREVLARDILGPG